MQKSLLQDKNEWLRIASYKTIMKIYVLQGGNQRTIIKLAQTIEQATQTFQMLLVTFVAGRTRLQLLQLAEVAFEVL